MMNPDAYPDIDQWQDDYRPQTGQRAGPECLPEGEYTFVVVAAGLDRVSGDTETVFRLLLRVVGGPHDGTELERPTFFRRQESLDFLGGDLVKLGFDADQWGRRGRPWSAELLDACARLPGVRLHGRRVDSPGKPGQKPFANLWIDGLAGGGTPAPPGRQPQAAQHNLPMNLDDQIPF